MLLILISTSLSANAQVGAVVGVVGGGLLLDEAADNINDSVARAEAAAHGLLGRADSIAKTRLDQIDAIVQKAIRDVSQQSEETALRILKQAQKDIDEIRSQTMADVRAVIWETECAGKRFVIDDIPTALGGLGRFLNVNEFEIVPPVYLLDRPRNPIERFFGTDPYIIQIKTPFDRTYVDVRSIMEAAIASDIVNDETPAHHVIATWEYLAAFALKTSCFYYNSSDRWNQEYINYKEQAKSWRDLVLVRVQ